jgi:hypothetical protein
MPIGLAGSTEDRSALRLPGIAAGDRTYSNRFRRLWPKLQLLAFAAESRIRKHKDQFNSLTDATLECVALSCLLTDENGWYN